MLTSDVSNKVRTSTYSTTYVLHTEFILKTKFSIEEGGNTFEASRKTSEKSKVVNENKPDLDKPTTTTIDNLTRKKEKRRRDARIMIVEGLQESLFPRPEDKLWKSRSNPNRIDANLNNVQLCG